MSTLATQAITIRRDRAPAFGSKISSENRAEKRQWVSHIEDTAAGWLPYKTLTACTGGFFYAARRPPPTKNHRTESGG